MGRRDARQLLQIVRADANSGIEILYLVLERSQCRRRTDRAAERRLPRGTLIGIAHITVNLPHYGIAIVGYVLVDLLPAHFCATRQIVRKFAGFTKIRRSNPRLGAWCAGCKSGVGPAMSAPSAGFPALSASTSSSGYRDGFGRRALAFDREDGTMLERLAVRAELSAFGRSLRDRLERIAAIDDERIAKPRSIERAGDGSLVVLSEYVPGTRLSELIDETARQGSVPGVEVALGFLLDILPALCGLHAGAGFAHGGVTAGRTVLTPAGQVVILDAIFGEALSRLRYSRNRLWAEFGIAMPPGRGPARFDAACDVSQAVLSAVMLMLGRPVAEHEHPDVIPSLLVEVVDVAQIRGGNEFAAGLQRFLQRSLPLPGRRPYATADD